MGVISNNKRKLTIYYHSGTSIGKQTYAYVSASKKKLLAIDIAKTNVTGTQWVELAAKLGKDVSDLINTNNPNFIKNYGDKSKIMETHDWLKILDKAPILLKYPIVIYGEDYLEIKTASAFKQYFEPDSTEIEKPSLGKQFIGENLS